MINIFVTFLRRSRKPIYRYYPVYGPFPWGHVSARHHLTAYLNLADNNRNLLLKGYSATPSQVEALGDGTVITSMLKLHPKGLWHPEDYGYPDSYTIGKLTQNDWNDFLKTFKECPEFKLLKTSFG